MFNMAGLLDSIGDFIGQSPIGLLYQEHKEGQARDESRQVRAEDIERDEKWLERNSLTNRIQEGMKSGLSLTAAAGVQPSNSMTATVGQDTSHLNRSQNYDPTQKLQARLLQSQINGVELDNLKKAQELEKPPTPGTPTAGDSFMPGGSQGIKGGKRIVDKPMERTASYPGKGHMEAGASNDIGFIKTATGYAPVPSTDAKQKIEDSPYEFIHFIRNGLMPNFGSLENQPPLSELPPWANAWKWSKSKQEYQPYKTSWTDDPVGHFMNQLKGGKK